jgi:ion channel-forming bestrophin family protein
LKHYLRREEGIYYQDLHHLVKFLPAYALPAGIPASPSVEPEAAKEQDESIPDLPLPASMGLKKRPTINIVDTDAPNGGAAPRNKTSTAPAGNSDLHITLLPAHNPPKWSIFDFFPFPPFSRRKASRDRARRGLGQNGPESGNVPLEITLYLSSYLAMLQNRNLTDGLSIGLLHDALAQLTGALSGLERFVFFFALCLALTDLFTDLLGRILTTPIPFAYAVHLWMITVLYLATLPFQLYGTLGWLTIPAVALAAFTFTGLMKLSEEIENPFGYDYNDLSRSFCKLTFIHRLMNFL